MKHTLILTMLSATALVGQQALAGFVGNYYASDNRPGDINIYEYSEPDVTWSNTLVLDEDLTLSTRNLNFEGEVYVDIQSSKGEVNEIFVADEKTLTIYPNAFFHINFDNESQNIITSANGPITLVEVEQGAGGIVFHSYTPGRVKLLLNDVSYGNNIMFGGKNYTYVAPITKPEELYEGQIAFMGFYKDSTEISIVAKGLSFVPNSVVPEPATGTLSLLALCALAARRRKR